MNVIDLSNFKNYKSNSGLDLILVRSRNNCNALANLFRLGFGHRKRNIHFKIRSFVPQKTPQQYQKLIS